MTGYVESLTDPSYRGQVLVLSYPLIGNYGVPPPTKDENGLDLFYESEKVSALQDLTQRCQIQVAALVVADYSEEYSHWNAISSLGDWLKSQNVPAIFGVDTRALIKHLSVSGSTLAKIIVGDNKVRHSLSEEPNVL